MDVIGHFNNTNEGRKTRRIVYFLNETNVYLFSMRVIGENVIQILEYYS